MNAASDAFDLRGRIALVTAASRGIGYTTGVCLPVDGGYLVK